MLFSSAFCKPDVFLVANYKHLTASVFVAYAYAREWKLIIIKNYPLGSLHHSIVSLMPLSLRVCIENEGSTRYLAFLFFFIRMKTAEVIYIRNCFLVYSALGNRSKTCTVVAKNVTPVWLFGVLTCSWKNRLLCFQLKELFSVCFLQCLTGKQLLDLRWDFFFGIEKSYPITQKKHNRELK